MSFRHLVGAVEHRLRSSGSATPKNNAFSIYRAFQQQLLLDVPMVKPTLMAVLKGLKKYGHADPFDIAEGHFLFISETSRVQMRNIPKTDSYIALLVPFEWSDFDELQTRQAPSPVAGERPFVHAALPEDVCLSLEQLVDGAERMPAELLARRRQEMLWLLLRAGHKEVVSLGRRRRFGSQVFALLSASVEASPSAAEVAKALAVSESTLRRRLNEEGATLQSIRDQVRMGLGLHLLQSSEASIAQIALQCGYQSQSRFSSRFKQRFGIAPHELRRTRLTGSGDTLTG
ncbi:MAG: helix-turn-helix transcriptional regulator [Myxococcota bacterium]